MNKTHYQTLGLCESASLKEIKKAYRSLALLYHPDRNQGNPKSESIFKQVNGAYYVLSDPNKKSKYDDLLRSIRAST